MLFKSSFKNQLKTLTKQSLLPLILATSAATAATAATPATPATPNEICNGLAEAHAQYSSGSSLKVAVERSLDPAFIPNLRLGNGTIVDVCNYYLRTPPEGIPFTLFECTVPYSYAVNPKSESAQNKLAEINKKVYEGKPCECQKR
ncbi:MAG: hypothetical protein DRR08_15600 [Candidatus Parabeggiatoa sp. nov. 2]|nr:MAG: hypothetical protein B6247_24555 [Beggiatoa sp. 4572_84]RKZ58745.1 MAG: hypothetical protein DRR08_15600 [Gammaproteobacteria bacterium]